MIDPQRLPAADGEIRQQSKLRVGHKDRIAAWEVLVRMRWRASGPRDEA